MHDGGDKTGALSRTVGDGLGATVDSDVRGGVDGADADGREIIDDDLGRGGVSWGNGEGSVG